MRFCPFCAQENADEASACAHCGRRLPQLASAQGATQIKRPKVPTPRRVPRPFPRTRPVTPAPALPTPPPAPEAAAPKVTTPMSASRARSGTLLGIAATPSPAAKPALREEPATRVEASPFDVPTALNAPVMTTDLLDPAAPTALEVERTTQESALNFDGESTAIDMTRPSSEDIPTSRNVPLPTMRDMDQPLELPAIPLPPPPPGPAKGLREDDFLDEQSVRFAPRDSAQPAPIVELDVVAPMPESPGAKIIPAVRYLVPVAKAIWARRQMQATLRTLLLEDQRRVDEALRDLGDVAWQLKPRPQELRSELDRADDDDARRRAAVKELARLDMSVANEKERFADEDGQRVAELQRREAEVVRLTEDLAERKRAQKTEDKILREMETRLRASEKKVAQHLARADKAERTPPDKGGGPHAAANARNDAAAAQQEVDGYHPQVEEQLSKVRALDEPIAALDVALTGEKAIVLTQKSELEAARRTHADKLLAFAMERATQEEMRAVAERGVKLRLVSTGTLLSLHRMDNPRFVDVYARLDQLQAIASARDARISALEAERQGYDRAAVQRGLIVLGGAVGLFAILLVVLMIIVRH